MSKPRFSGSVSLMATTLPFAQRFDALARAGFEGVEIQRIGEARGVDVARTARDAGLAVALVNVEMGDLVTGGPGLSGVPGREPEFRRRFLEAAEFAAYTGAATLHLAPSRVPEGTARGICYAAYEANLAWALERVRGASVTIVIEPINPFDVPNVLLDDLLQGARLAATAGVGLLFDAYHVARLGLDPAAAFAAHAEVISHVQVSDMPGRVAPGKGTIDFPRLFATVAAGGYAGWIGAEYASDTLSITDCAWLAAARAACSQPDAAQAARS